MFQKRQIKKGDIVLFESMYGIVVNIIDVQTGYRKNKKIRRLYQVMFRCGLLVLDDEIIDIP